MPRHVMLLTRDPSLVVAVKALLDDEDRVIELESPQELPQVGELPVDAVVVDLPSALRAASVERVRGRFSGPLVVLLGHGEDAAKARVTYRCSVLTRPFGMAQLWSMLVSSAAEAVTEVIPQIHRAAPSRDVRRDPSGSPAAAAASERPVAAARAERPGGVSDRPAPAAGHARMSGLPTQAPERPGSPPQLGASETPLAAQRHAPDAQQRPETPQRRAPEVPQQPANRSAPPATPGRAKEPGRDAQAPGSGTTRAIRGEGEEGVQPNRAARHGPKVPAWSWRLRRFQHVEAEAPDSELTQPLPRIPPSGNGSTPAPERAASPPEAVAAGAGQVSMRPEVEGTVDATARRANGEVPQAPARAAITREDPLPDPPEAVAGRLAERLGADAVALLLDNNYGLLEVAGGVGLTTAERQLQVQYGHEVLLELFRVGVGLIEDTDRVRELIRGIPGSRSQSLVMVPLVHEGHGFGALIIGRSSPPGQPRAEFTEREIEALMDYADDVAPPLRSTVLLRRLMGQLKSPEGT